MKRLVPALALACCLSCARYADFRLPAVSGEATPEASWRLDSSPEPVLRAGPESYDASDALNPAIAFRDGVWWNFYSAFDGSTWHTALATSPDGTHWTKRGKALSPGALYWEGNYIAANGAVLVQAGEFWYWYHTGPRELPRIALATSRDGASWTRRATPVLEPGPRGSWDERGVADPFVVRAGGEFFLFYLGQDRARRQRLGVARSPDGVTWEKLRSNPLLETGDFGAFDENGLGEPAVWQHGGYWWMLYTGRARDEQRRMGLARSRDGAVWEKLPGAIAGTADWNRKVLCDPEVAVTPKGIRVWFGGGDRASPDERLHGAIGEGVLTRVSLRP